MEAYVFESDLSYAKKNPHGTNGWRVFTTMTLPQRLEILNKKHVL